MSNPQLNPGSNIRTFTIFGYNKPGEVRVLAENLLASKYNSQLQHALGIIARALRAELERNLKGDIVINNAVRPFLYFSTKNGVRIITVQCPDTKDELLDFLHNPVVIIREAQQAGHPPRSSFPTLQPLVEPKTPRLPSGYQPVPVHHDSGSPSSVLARPPPLPTTASEAYRSHHLTTTTHPNVSGSLSGNGSQSTSSLDESTILWLAEYESMHGDPNNGGRCSLGQLARALEDNLGIRMGTKQLGKLLAAAGFHGKARKSNLEVVQFPESPNAVIRTVPSQPAVTKTDDPVRTIDPAPEPVQPKTSGAVPSLGSGNSPNFEPVGQNPPNAPAVEPAKGPIPSSATIQTSNLSNRAIADKHVGDVIAFMQSNPFCSYEDISNFLAGFGANMSRGYVGVVLTSWRQAGHDVPYIRPRKSK